jgi:putative transposase
MAQPKRIFEPNISVHVIHRGNNRMAIFSDDSDFELFLVFLKRSSKRFGLAVHGFALMSNHYHLVVTPPNAGALPATMKVLNVRYVRYFNRKYTRVGTLFTGRYRAIPLVDESQWVTCLRYVDLNPLRARIVRDPAAYPWSSYAAHALGESIPWLESHPAYDALGCDEPDRQRAYYTLCRTPLTETDLVLQHFHAESARHSVSCNPL